MSLDTIAGGGDTLAAFDDPGVLAAAAALDREAAALESGAVTIAGAVAAAPVDVDWIQEAGHFTTFAREMFFPLYPRLEQVWTEKKIEALNGRLAVVLQKHDITLLKILGKWGPEIMLAAVIVPSVLPSYKAIAQDLADLKAQAAEKARAAPSKGQPSAPAPPAPTPAQDAAASSPAVPGGPPDTAQLHKQV